MNAKFRFTFLPLYRWGRDLCAMIWRQIQNIWFYQEVNSFNSFVVQLLVTAPSGQFRLSSFACNVREAHVWSETTVLFVLLFKNSVNHKFRACIWIRSNEMQQYAGVYLLVVALTLWAVPEAAVTVCCTPDDGCDRHP